MGDRPWNTRRTKGNPKLHLHSSTPHETRADPQTQRGSCKRWRKIRDQLAPHALELKLQSFLVEPNLKPQRARRCTKDFLCEPSCPWWFPGLAVLRRLREVRRLFAGLVFWCLQARTCPESPRIVCESNNRCAVARHLPPSSPSFRLFSFSPITFFTRRGHFATRHAIPDGCKLVLECYR